MTATTTIQNTQIDAKRVLALCDKWGLEKAPDSKPGETAVMIDGARVALKLGNPGHINYSVEKLARLTDKTVEEFLRGPLKVPSARMGPALNQTRIRVLTYLSRHGNVTDEKSGRATSKLQEAAGLGGGLTTLLQQMEGEGQITREVRGKRTYKIALVPHGPMVDELLAMGGAAPPTAPATPGAPAEAVAEPPAGEESLPEVSAREVADFLYEKVLEVVNSGSRERFERELGEVEVRLATATEYAAVAKRRVEAMEQELHSMRESNSRLIAEREAARKEVIRLTEAVERLEKVKAPTAAKRTVPHTVVAQTRRRKGGRR